MSEQVVYQKGWEWLADHKAPGIAGLSDGPGSGKHEFVYDRPRPKQDIPRTLAMMEEAGKLKKPADLAMAKLKYEEAKTMPDSKIDYQKGGHPLDD